MSKTIAPPEAPQDEAAQAAGPGEAAPQATPVDLAYAGVSRAVVAPAEAEIDLVGNLRRDPVRFDATVKDPVRFREALSALYAIVGADYRYVPKDRAAYAAFVRMRRQSQALGAWQSQQAYYAWLLRNAPDASLILDPVVAVHPDRVSFDVFSKDEGTYANLGVDRSAFDVAGEPAYGTTNIDFSQSLFDGLQQMRSYRRTRLTIGREAVGLSTEAGGPKGEVLEKRVNVPDSWLRGFLQVQSAATL